VILPNYTSKQLEQITHGLSRMSKNISITIDEEIITVTQTLEEESLVIAKFHFAVGMGHVNTIKVNEFKGTDSKLVRGIDSWYSAIRHFLSNQRTK
jgi:hypothetical protein